MATALVAMDSDCRALSREVIEAGWRLRKMESRKEGHGRGCGSRLVQMMGAVVLTSL